MGWLNAPVRLVRDLSIGVKLAGTVVGALSLLAAVSWFAFDRLNFVTAMQEDVAAQSAAEHQVQRSLLAAQELRVVSRELPTQQTIAGVRATLERAATQADLAKKLMLDIKAGPDQPLLGNALAQLDAMAAAVGKTAELRAAMLTARQKRLFQARPVFEAAMATLMGELARGAALDTGVNSVRDTSAPAAQVDLNDPALEAASHYRLAMSRVQAAAMMFMATGAGSAANEVRDATAEAATALAAILSSPIPEAIKADVQMAGNIGQAIATAAGDLIAMSRQLDQVAGAEVETASQAMRAGFEKLAAASAERQKWASDTALEAGKAAARHILAMVGATALLMATLGTAVTQMLASPIRRLTRIVQAIASGETGQSVPYTARRDEIGRMAASVGTLRDVMRQAFIQAQMIEQLPVGVMTAEATANLRIGYLNAEARQILRTVQGQIDVPVDDLVGRDVPKALLPLGWAADPANLPHRARIVVGAETLDLGVSAIHDRNGLYIGPLLTWRTVTGQARLVRQFEETVGAVARTVADAADGMCQAATVMRHGVGVAGERTAAVSVASSQASHNVTAAAAGAEQVAASAAEIGRQVAESAQIAATALSEARATDASVGSLSEAASRISAVVGLISDIAARTNLLALNATIEAARAGDAGKGFAVVAGEVKNLATQTAKATQDIGGQIAAMQQATGHTVKALRSIGGTIERMNEIATVIANSVRAQGAATQSIAQAVQHAAAGTSVVNGSIAMFTQVVEETGSQAGGVVEAAMGMTRQAAVLREEVARFLVAVQQAA